MSALRPIDDLRETVNRAAYLPALQSFAYSLIDHIEGRSGTVDSVRLCRGHEHRDGWNVPTDEYTLPVRYDPAMPTRGELHQQHDFNGVWWPRTILLREWDERVLLHEVLHVLLNGRVTLTEDDPDGHGVIAHVETALILAGWRFAGPVTATPRDPDERPEQPYCKGAGMPVEDQQ